MMAEEVSSDCCSVEGEGWGMMAGEVSGDCCREGVGNDGGQ